MGTPAFQALSEPAKASFREAYFNVSSALTMYASAVLGEEVSLEETLLRLFPRLMDFCYQCSEHGVHNTPSTFESYRQKLVASGLSYLEVLEAVADAS
jgi:hypothetical protein